MASSFSYSISDDQQLRMQLRIAGQGNPMRQGVIDKRRARRSLRSTESQPGSARERGNPWHE